MEKNLVPASKSETSLNFSRPKVAGLLYYSLPHPKATAGFLGLINSDLGSVCPHRLLVTAETCLEWTFFFFFFCLSLCVCFDNYCFYMSVNMVSNFVVLLFLPALLSSCILHQFPKFCLIFLCFQALLLIFSSSLIYLFFPTPFEFSPERKITI